MSIEQNKAVARRFIEEVWNDGRLEVADELLAPDLVSHGQPPGETGNRDSFTRYIATTRERYPGLRLELEDLIAEGDRVATRVTVRGGTLDGQANTVTALGIIRVVDGRIAEQWVDVPAR